MLAWDSRCGGGKACTKKGWAASRVLLKTALRTALFRISIRKHGQQGRRSNCEDDTRPEGAISTKESQTITEEELDDAGDQSNIGTEQHTTARACTQGQPFLL